MAGEKSLEIVDAHVHFWMPATHKWVAKAVSEPPFVGKYNFSPAYLPEDYRKDAEGYHVTHLVHVEAGWGKDEVGETVWLDSIADKDALRTPQAIVGHCDLSSELAREVIQRHCQSKRFKGIRQLLYYHPTKSVPFMAPHDDYFTDPKWLSGVSLLQEFNLSLEFLIDATQTHRAAQVARQFPNVKFMLEHCGIAYSTNEKTTLWREGLAELASQSNVYCKVSGMFWDCPGWTQESVMKRTQPCFDLFGLDRCVFASNFPVDRMNVSFSDVIACLQPIMQRYTPEERDKYFSGNAKKFYGLEK